MMHEDETNEYKSAIRELQAWPHCGPSVSRLTATGNEVHSPFLWSIKTMRAVVVLVPVAWTFKSRLEAAFVMLAPPPSFLFLRPQSSRRGNKCLFPQESTKNFAVLCHRYEDRIRQKEQRRSDITASRQL